MGKRRRAQKYASLNPKPSDDDDDDYVVEGVRNLARVFHPPLRRKPYKK